MAEFKPDLVHGQHVWMLSALASETNLPLVLTAHGTDLMGCDKWPHWRTYAKRAMDACERVICISLDNERLVRQMFPEHSPKVALMSNGYNPAIFFVQDIDRKRVLEPYGIDPSGMRVVLFAGKLTDFNGVDVLLDAAARYESTMSNVLTLIAGDGELREALHQQAKRLNLPRRISWATSSRTSSVGFITAPMSTLFQADESRSDWWPSRLSPAAHPWWQLTKEAFPIS